MILKELGLKRGMLIVRSFLLVNFYEDKKSKKAWIQTYGKILSNKYFKMNTI